jgi:hypothetical protein
MSCFWKMRRQLSFEGTEVSLDHGGRHGEESYLNQAGVSIVFWYLTLGVNMCRSSTLGMIEYVVSM